MKNYIVQNAKNKLSRVFRINRANVQAIQFASRFCLVEVNMPKGQSVMHILITASDLETLSALLREHRLDTEGGAQDEKGGVHIEAFVPEKLIDRLKVKGISIEVLENASETLRARQKEVGKGNRFEGENRVPQGLGRSIKGD
jgi:hypothetical protein